MKFKLLIILLTYCNILFSQEKAIYVNQNNDVRLIFDSPIAHGKPGNKAFSFSHYPNISSRIGIVKGAIGNTNLFVELRNGLMYSFKLKYRENINNYYYKIKHGDAINVGEEIQITTNTKKEKKEDKKDQPKEEPKKEYLGKTEIMCSKLAKKEPFFKRFSKTEDEITLTLKNVIYYNDEIYFSMNIANNSYIDYDINYLNFFIVTSGKKGRGIYQKTPLDMNKNDKYPYIYNLNRNIKSNSENNIVYVVKKFSLNNKKSVLIELNEEKGERNIALEIPHKIINNPN